MLMIANQGTRVREISHMLSDYIKAAMARATYERLADAGTWFGRIPGLEGVWGNAVTQEDCQVELQEVLEEWIMLRLSEHLPIPPVDGIELTIRTVA
jgi:predicted RNase H-like HicB family nuclease